MSEGTSTLEQPTESNVVDVSEQVQAANANGSNGTNSDGTQGEGKSVNRWAEKKHLFATPHPAHELIASQTGYGRDLKDEHGNWIEKKPDGFDRVILPNLIPADRLAEAERLCRMHNVDIRDEWRFAQLQMTEAVINELSKLPVPTDYREQTNRLTADEREVKKQVSEARKAEMEALKEQGRKLREEMARKREEIREETARKIAERKGIPYVPTTQPITLGDIPFSEPVAPPTPSPAAPVTEVQPASQDVNANNGNETSAKKK